MADPAAPWVKLGDELGSMDCPPGRAVVVARRPGVGFAMLVRGDERGHESVRLLASGFDPAVRHEVVWEVLVP